MHCWLAVISQNTEQNTQRGRDDVSHKLGCGEELVSKKKKKSTKQTLQSGSWWHIKCFLI